MHGKPIVRVKAKTVSALRILGKTNHAKVHRLRKPQFAPLLGKKVKFSLEQAKKAQTGSRGIALLFL